MPDPDPVPSKIDFARIRRWHERLKEYQFDPKTSELHRIERKAEDSSLAPNFPKGMRPVDFNAMREAQVVQETYEQIQRGSCRSNAGQDVYAEPAEPFYISPDKVPGPVADPNAGHKPSSWAHTAGKGRRERAVKAAEARAAQYKKIEPKVVKAAKTAKAGKKTTTKKKAKKGTK